MLHVDLWIAGQNILRDAGSYSYNCAEPWKSYFHSTAAHNTLQIDGLDQMVHGPKFLWYKWTKSCLSRFETSPDGRVSFFAGEHYGYTQLSEAVIHRRSICRISDCYFIVDQVRGTGVHDLTLRWRLIQADWQERAGVWWTPLNDDEIVIACRSTGEAEISLLATKRDAADSRESLYYGSKEAAPSVRLRSTSQLPFTALTVIGPKHQLEHIKASDVTEYLDQCARPVVSEFFDGWAKT